MLDVEGRWRAAKWLIACCYTGATKTANSWRQTGTNQRLTRIEAATDAQWLNVAAAPQQAWRAGANGVQEAQRTHWSGANKCSWTLQLLVQWNATQSSRKPNAWRQWWLQVTSGGYGATGECGPL